MADNLGVGIHRISNEVYHADPCDKPSLTRGSICNLIYHSPFYAWWNNPRLNPLFVREEKTQFDLGGVAHSLLLEGVDCCTVIDADDWRKKEAKELRDAARLEGKVPLLRKQYDEVNEMALEAKRQIAKSELGILDLQTEGDSELSYIWKEGETYLRCRPDWISKDRKIMLDYKTTGESANPNSAERKFVSMGYDIQNALYVRGVKAIEDVAPRFCFVVQETEKPYLCSFIGLSPAFRDIGRQKVDYGVDIWNYCLETGEWPAYPKRIAWLEPSPWVLNSWNAVAENIEIGGEQYA